MDSAREEPELPSAIQDLVQRLEGQGEPITQLPNLSWHAPEFFPERASLSTITGWRSQVRHRVLEAIGNCNTFESLNVGDICDDDISRLTASEWEIVFRGFRLSARCWSNLASGLRGHSDSKLKWLELGGDVWEDESAVKHVAEMINSAPLLETLTLQGFSEDMEDETVEILSQRWSRARH
ncbi:hypothetical protein AXG93_1774s1000 [Marchantia polymorpha subsp. ruderalis]|uniref:Uncharacterized protein n=1 Tax=Marchantia polymorpha subsp. ruderalis TaxID=1480154 RepID=A0A176W339_MARPO|nr:hypothetical protein AXG93_1774s1000 [Marchantia polymorpha subsp. ruderalis]